MKRADSGGRSTVTRFLCHPVWFFLACFFAIGFYWIYDDVASTLELEKEALRKARVDDEQFFKARDDRYEREQLGKKD